MISKITGIVSAATENRVIVDVDGVGYEVYVPTSLCSAMLNKKGERITFYTYHYLQGGPGAASTSGLERVQRWHRSSGRSSDRPHRVSRAIEAQAMDRPQPGSGCPGGVRTPWGLCQPQLRQK